MVQSTVACAYDEPVMDIAADTVVTLSYDITTEDGEIVESSDISGPITFLYGSGALIPGLDKRVEGLAEGDEKTFDIPPAEAFGTEENAPRKEIPRKELPEGMDVKVGLELEAGLPGGQTIKLKVVEVDDEKATALMLHPLAGKTIGMAIKVLGVRPATAAEKEAGRAIVRPPAPPPKK